MTTSTKRGCRECGRKLTSRQRIWCSNKCRKRNERKRQLPWSVRDDLINQRRRKHRQIYGHTDFLDDPMRNKKNRYAAAQKLGYRSGLEVKIARHLDERGIKYSYESVVLEYQQPAKKRQYTPDFVLPNGIIIEGKGRMVTAERQKMLMVKQCHPHLDIRFVFSNPQQRISKQSQTTYAMWCEKHGFKYAREVIPDEWLKEPKRK